MVEVTYLRKEKTMMKLSDREWDAFKIDDIMDVATGSNVSKGLLKDGLLPRITAKATDNGVDCFTMPYMRFRLNSNCVSVSFLGNAFYQPYKASYDMKIHSVTIKGRKLNRYVGLFIANQFNREFKKYSYGNQLSSTDLPKQKVLLPITTDKQPDWQFMEDFMREQEMLLLNPAIESLSNRLNISEIGGGRATKWKEFIFGKEFSILATKSGIDKNKLILGRGTIPYLTRTDIDNGYDGFIPTQAARYKVDEGNVITIGLDTQTVFYQPTAFYTGQNIQVIRHEKLDKYNAMFLVVAIKKLVERFSWGSYGATLTRLRKSRIYLPANENGDIDFEYMSSFMLQQENKMLQEALRYFEKRLTA